ncbi:MAG TPA: CRTAC1 family protein [Acidobacteriota bacterium]|nr:CRTAC1 family protein [Acidobacteriota bacterium]
MSAVHFHGSLPKLLWAMAGLAVMSTSDVRAEGPGLRFQDVSAQAGLTRVLLSGRPDKEHLLDSAGGGAAWLDYDRDGWMDLYLVNGWELKGNRIVRKGQNALYRNQGDGTFRDVTDQAGVGDRQHWGGGVAVADYDDDGWPDILVTNFGANVLFHNQGDGTFRDVAARAGIQAPGWNTGAAFFDADRDGDLDLYIAAYIEATLEDVLEARASLDWKGVAKVAMGPFGLQGAQDRFFLSDGEGRFREATESAGLEDRGRGYGFAVRAADFDGDGDPDLYVANDSDANYFYRNRGDGTFEEIGLWNGSALDLNGAAQAGMGLAVGDVQGDGLLDIFVTNFSEDFSTLYRGLGRGFFEDASIDSGLGDATYASLSWGAALADLDQDADLDLVIAHGHIYPQVDSHPEIGMHYRQTNQILINSGGGAFQDATPSAGPAFQAAQSSRGLALADFDNDGDLDLLFTHLDAPPTLLRNDTQGGNWLNVACQTPPGQGGVIGTSVWVTVKEKIQRRDIASSGSFLSAHDPRLHFGLGAARRADQVKVVWPDGSTTVLKDVAANQFLEIQKVPSQDPAPGGASGAQNPTGE